LQEIKNEATKNLSKKNTSNVLINEFNYRFLFTARVLVADTINDSNKLYNKYEMKKLIKQKIIQSFAI